MCYTKTIIKIISTRYNYRLSSMGRDTTFIIYENIPHNPSKDCYNLEFENATYEHYTYITDKYFKKYHQMYIEYIVKEVCPKCLFIKFFDDKEVYELAKKLSTKSSTSTLETSSDQIICPIVDEINVHHCYGSSLIRSSWYIDYIVQSIVVHEVCKEFNAKSFIDTLIYFQKKGKPTNFASEKDDIDDEAAYGETYDILLKLQKYFIDDSRDLKVLYVPDEV